MKISKNGVAEIFQRCGVSKGDSIFLHSNVFVTSELEGNDNYEKMNTFFEGILIAIGSEGTLSVPTFTYSGTNGEIYNVLKTKSEVGVLTEFFRNQTGVLRSLNPLFSVASKGAMAKRFQDSSFTDCFGEETCFGIMHELNTWIFTIGCSFNSMTFIHYVDQMAKANYRYFKSFPVIIIDSTGTQHSVDIRYLVRDLNRKTLVKLDHLEARLKKDGLLKNGKIGRTSFTGVRANDFFDVALEMMLKTPNVHIQEGY